MGPWDSTDLRFM